MTAPSLSSCRDAFVITYALPQSTDDVVVIAALPADAEADWTPPILHTLGLFAVMRVSEAVLWPDPFADLDTAHLGARYKDTFTKAPLFDASKPAFQWDGDSWAVNVVGHGLLGSELYLRARMCHFGPLGSLAFAAGASAFWEYAVEGSGVRPSALDLVYTPLAGMLLGEGRYWRYQRAGTLESKGLMGALRVVLDPFGETERVSGLAGC